MGTKKMITAAQLAAQWSISPVWVRRMCQHGRIKGAVKFGRDWMVPPGAKYPQLFKRGPKPA
jgi:hypothetical protein